MEFETRAQQDVYQKIEPWLKEMFGIFFHPCEDDPYFEIHVGAAPVYVGVQPWTVENASITARTYVALNINVHPDLLLFLLRENDSLRFGAFGLDADNDIFVEHTLPGFTVSAAELKSTILAVGQAAGQYEEQITARWGGIPASALQEEA
jgi:hypothetical protein